MVQPSLTALSNSTSFAWFDALVLLSVGMTAALWISRLRGLRGKNSIATTLAILVVDTVAIAAVLYLWFLCVWGLNYQRQPLREQLDFREDRITSDALRVLAARTVDALNALHPNAHAAGWPDFESTPDVLEPAFVRAQRDLALPWTAHAGRPKRTLFNFYFTRVSIDGMTGPFFLETLANGTLLPFERAATVAHEWSHLAGYADESEANFVGWLVCMRGPVSAQYSGWLSLYGTIAGALPRSERDDLIAAARRGSEGRSSRHLRSRSPACGSGRQSRGLCAVRSISESQQGRGRSTELRRSAAPASRHALRRQRLACASQRGIRGRGKGRGRLLPLAPCPSPLIPRPSPLAPRPCRATRGVARRRGGASAPSWCRPARAAPVPRPAREAA